MPHLVENKFLFGNDTESYITSLNEVTEFVKNNLPANTAKEIINFKVKMVVTELLNNALKHVKLGETSINVSISDDAVIIKKNDYGHRFNPNNLVSFLNNPSGFRVPLSEDAMHCVYAIVETECKVKFICDENFNQDLFNVNNIMEHFGLLIITKSADEFTYNYDKVTGLNTFRVVLKFG